MRVNTERSTMDMESRDISYVLSAYLRQYLFVSQNKDPKEIIMPKFPGVPHPYIPGVVIPVKYVEVDEPIAQEIAKDGSNVEEAPVVDEVAEDIKSTEPDVATESPAKAALKKEKDKVTEERKPKMPPSGDIGSGHPDGMGSRDVRLDRKIAADLKPEAKVDESKEIDTDIKKPQ